MKDTLSTADAAALLGVAVSTVATWIDQGDLKAGKTPGGHRRIVAKDLVDFLLQRNLPVPIELAESKHKVLVVDDEPAVAKLVSRVIRAAHPEYEVLVAHDGFAAGELVASARPDVVVLDLRMPQLDGFEVCRRIKSREDTKEIVVIAVTAYHSSKAQKEIMDCGASAYLVKPLDAEALVQQVEAAIGKGRSIRRKK